MRESESEWKGRLAALFLIWPFILIGFVMHFNSTEATTFDWIAGAIILIVSIIWAYIVVRYVRKLLS